MTNHIRTARNQNFRWKSDNLQFILMSKVQHYHQNSPHHSASAEERHMMSAHATNSLRVHLSSLKRSAYHTIESRSADSLRREEQAIKHGELFLLSVREMKE